jgi:hypothetical protein
MPESTCTPWCQIRGSREHIICRYDAGEYTGDDANVYVALLAYHHSGVTLDIAIVPHDEDGEAHSLIIDPRDAESVAALLDALGARDVAKAVREAGRVAESGEDA